jgi:hypothetical protein
VLPGRPALVGVPANTPGTPATDQRGFSRTSAAATDLGALEVQPSDSTAALTASPGPSVYGQAVTLTATLPLTLSGTLATASTVTFLDGSTGLSLRSVDERIRGIAVIGFGKLDLDVPVGPGLETMDPDFEFPLRQRGPLANVDEDNGRSWNLRDVSFRGRPEIDHDASQRRLRSAGRLGGYVVEQRESLGAMRRAGKPVR